MTNHARVAVAALVIRDGRVLFGKRKSALGNGTWGCPGGSLEFGESPEACVQREILEETGMKVTTLRLGAVTSDLFPDEEKQFITIFYVAETAGEPRLMEPHKCEGWQWFPWNHAPQPLFIAEETLMKQKYSPFDSEITTK